MNPKTIHKTHAATTSRQAAFNSRETASSLRAILPGLLLAACLMAALNAHGSGLGPIFPLQGGTQLATRPDGTTMLVETYNECVEPAHVLYREIRVGKIESGATNQMPFQVSASITSPGCRFPATNPDIAVNSTNAVIAYVDKEAVIGGDPDEYGIYYSQVDTNGSPTNALILAGSAESWNDEYVTRGASQFLARLTGEV